MGLMHLHKRKAVSEIVGGILLLLLYLLLVYLFIRIMMSGFNLIAFILLLLLLLFFFPFMVFGSINLIREASEMLRKGKNES